MNNNTKLSSTDPSSTPYGTRIVQVVCLFLCTLQTTTILGKPKGRDQINSYEYSC